MKKNKFLLVLLLLLSNLICFADTGFDDDVVDVPAPINQWVYIAMIAAVLYGYKSIMNVMKNPSTNKH